MMTQILAIIKLLLKFLFQKIFGNKLAWGFLCTRKKFFGLKKIFSKEKVIKLKNFTKIMPPIGFKVNIAGDRRKGKIGEGRCIYNSINII